jgi:two-component system nitrate/nitrite response regulator NarL
VAAVISKRLGCRPLLVKLRGLFESHDIALGRVAEEARAARRARIPTGTRPTHSSALGAANLTQREREVLSALAQGFSNRAIGQKLGVVEGTVKVHVRSVLRKLNLDSRLAAALWAAGHLPSGRSGVWRENKEP